MDLKQYYNRRQTLARAKFIEHAICDTIAAPTDLLLSDPETLTGFDRDYFDELAQAAMIQLLGVAADDPDQFMQLFNDPTTRTEQMRLTAHFASTQIFYRSMWLKAGRVLEPHRREATSNCGTPDRPGVTNAVFLLFFALHPDLDPASEDQLPEELTEELWTLYDRARKFFADHVGVQWRDFAMEILGETLPHSRRKIAKTSAKPLDLLSCKLYGGTSPEEGETNIRDAVETSRRGSKGDGAAVEYALEFKGLREQGTFLPMQITPFDERVTMAADALQAEKGKDEFFSLFELHRSMGFTGTPSDAQRKRIDDSVMKQLFTMVAIDNTAEVDAGYDYQPFHYRGSLLPIECMDSFIGGRYTDTTYHLLREPPIIAFAKRRGQYTTLPVELFQTPGSKTDVSIALENYMLYRIAQAKRELANLEDAKRKTEKVKQAIIKARQEPILLAKIYENVLPEEKEERNRMQQPRVRDRLEPILDHYKSCKWIADYELKDDRVTVILE